MDVILFTIFNGILYGMLLFMLSSGLTLIFGMMGVLNFAHASFFMLGAYFAYQISEFVGFYPALIIAPIINGSKQVLKKYTKINNTINEVSIAEVLFVPNLKGIED